MQIIDKEEFTTVGSIVINGKPFPIIETLVNGRPYRTVLTDKITVPQLATYTEVAELLRVSLSTVERWEKKGDMPKAFRMHDTVRFDLDEINAWMKRKGALKTVKEMRADQWVNDTSNGATIESMRAERGLSVNQDVPSEITLDIATLDRMGAEIDEIFAGPRTNEGAERMAKCITVFKELLEKLKPLREGIE